MEEILSLYNMDKLILQREQRHSMFHQTCLYISVIIILALLLSNIHIYRSRKRLQKNEKEIRRLTSIAEEANEIKSHFLTNMSYNIRILLTYIIHSGFISGYQNRYGDNLKPPTNVYHRMTA